jgi:hypothetical protein
MSDKIREIYVLHENLCPKTKVLMGHRVPPAVTLEIASSEKYLRVCKATFFKFH